MSLIVYLDETGNPTMAALDKDFPVFVLAMVVCEVDTYIHKIIPSFNEFKFKFFGHEGALLHSRDIRKAQGEFGFLTDPNQREVFIQELSSLMGGCDYQLITSVIRKEIHKQRYGGGAYNPYSLSLGFCMERLLPLLEKQDEKEVLLLAEARGKDEDGKLRKAFNMITKWGTDYIDHHRIKNIQFRLEFKSKKLNIIGHQMADLAGYPIARHVIDKTKDNPAFEIVKKKFYQGPGRVHGLKIFP